MNTIEVVAAIIEVEDLVLVVQRKENEKKIEKETGIVEVPEWSVLEEEKKELVPSVWLFIYDEEGNILRKMKGNNTKGIHRMSWNFLTASSALS